METIKGRIEKVETSTGTGAKGPWTRHAFTIDGKTYSTFDKDIGTKFGEGMDVVMTGEQSGKFWNMKTMEINLNVTAAEPPKPTETKPTARATPRTSDEITATELIRYAVKLYGDEKGDIKNFEKTCIQIWEEFERFKGKLNNG